MREAACLRVFALRIFYGFCIFMRVAAAGRVNYSRPFLRISIFSRLIFWFSVESGMRNCSAASV